MPVLSHTYEATNRSQIEKMDGRHPRHIVQPMLHSLRLVIHVNSGQCYIKSNIEECI